jgi:cytochrome P450 family 142 subfamily A polypeptide 1
VFEHADRFDIRRNPNSHLAFGFRTHFRLGHQLARLELSRMTGKVLQRLPDLRLADDSSLPLRQANFVSGPESMPVVFAPSAPVGYKGEGRASGVPRHWLTA